MEEPSGPSPCFASMLHAGIGDDGGAQGQLDPFTAPL
jgi:hypothetical protein